MNAPALPRLLLLALALLAGCAAIEKELHIEPHSPLRHLLVAAEVRANQDSATDVEVVFVYDVKAVEVLPKTAPEWFANRQALLSELAQAVETVRAGVPPSGLYELPLPPRHRKAVRVYGYANYLVAGGQRVQDLTPYACGLLVLGADAVSRRPCR